MTFKLSLIPLETCGKAVTTFFLRHLNLSLITAERQTAKL